MAKKRRTNRPADGSLPASSPKRVATEMSHLDGLPEELLDIVVRQLDTKDLNNMVRVSHKLHRIAEPHLYASYHNPIKKVTEYEQFQLLHRTLVRRPDLANRMHSVKLKWEPMWSGGVFLHKNYISEVKPAKHVQELLQAAKCVAMGHEDKAIFLRHLEEGTEGAEVTLFLALLPNLRRLTIGVNVWGLIDRSLIRLLKATTASQAITASTPFSNLCTLKLNNNFLWPHESAATLISFLTLPSLRKVHCKYIIFDRPQQWPIQKSNVSRVVFEQIDGEIEDVVGFCNACKALNTLSVDWTEVDHTPTDFAELPTALLLHRDSLETLVLDITDKGSVEWDDTTPLLQGGLKPLHRLRFLSVTFSFFLGSSYEEIESTALLDWFPVSLEVLAINSEVTYESSFHNFLKFLAGAGRAAMPKLRRIEVPREPNGIIKDSEDEETWEDILESLGPIFKSWSVELVSKWVEDIHCDFRGRCI